MCGKFNHFAKCCPKQETRKKIGLHEVIDIDPHNICNESRDDNNDIGLSEGLDELFIDGIQVQEKKLDLKIDSVSNLRPTAWYEIIQIGKQKVRFKLDTGAEISVLPLNVFQGLDIENKLNKTNSILVAFGNKSQIITEGIVNIKCSSKNQTNQIIRFVVVNVISVPLLGLSDCIKLKLVKKIGVNYIAENMDKSDVIKKHIEVFEGCGKLPGLCHIELKEKAVPKIHAPRRVPFSLHDKLKNTLDDLVKRHIISPVTKPTEWVNSLVIVEKPDRSLRLCLDPRDLNGVIKREHYLIPKTEDLIARLSGKTVFSVLDMKEGFWQIQLDSTSSYLTTFNTPFGRYRFHRLPYGLCSAPEIFQKRNFDIFGDITGCEVYFDDIIIAGSTREEHDNILAVVLQRAKVNNIKFNQQKFQFRVPTVKFVGRIVSAEGIKPDPQHVRAILNMEKPKDKGGLLRLLGMAKYLSKFIPNLSTITAPLRNLTKNNVEWMWMCEHDRSLHELKLSLANAPVLTIFNNSRKLVLQCDASRDGLGACLMQDDHPISYASRSLTESEQRFAQIEKELLSITYGLETFHQFTYGKLVHVQTDHKPLVTIVDKDISKVSARLQRLLLKLLKYQVSVSYVPGKQLIMADTLSRAYLNDKVKDDPELLYIVHTLSKYLPISIERKQKFVVETEKDNELKALKEFYYNGWPDSKIKCPRNVRYYYNLQDKLSVEEDLLFMDHKLVVPVSLRQTMLNLIHESHLGIEKCKSRARQVLFWPGMSRDIQNEVLKCKICEKFRKTNSKETLLNHPIPDRPWQKLATDLFQFGTNDYLIVTDYYSRWIEVLSLNGKTATHIIKKLKSLFSRFGIPEIVISDNMPFGSLEFKTFTKEWDFQSITSSPLHSQSNGLAEKSVSIVKNMLRKAFEGGQDIYISLMEYRNTPLRDTKLSPTQLMLNRRIRTKIPSTAHLLKPDNFDVNVKASLIKKNIKTKQWYDRNAHDLPPLQPSDSVMIRQGNYWEPGQVVAKCPTPRSYVIRQTNGREIRRNRKWLRRSANPSPANTNVELSMPLHDMPKLDNDGPGQYKPQESPLALPSDSQAVTVQPQRTTASGRVVKAPSRLNL